MRLTSFILRQPCILNLELGYQYILTVDPLLHAVNLQVQVLNLLLKFLLLYLIKRNVTYQLSELV